MLHLKVKPKDPDSPTCKLGMNVAFIFIVTDILYNLGIGGWRVGCGFMIMIYYRGGRGGDYTGK